MNATSPSSDPDEPAAEQPQTTQDGRQVVTGGLPELSGSEQALPSTLNPVVRDRLEV